MYQKSIGRLQSKQLEAIRAGRYRSGKSELHDGGGLYLRLNPTGGGYWLFCYMLNGRKGKVGIGSLGPINATAARDKAHELRLKVRAKIDPLAEAKVEHSAELATIIKGEAQTFDDEAQAFIASMREAKQSEKQLGNYERWRTEHCKPILGSLLIDHIETPHVVKSVVPLMIEAPVSGKRCCRFIKRVIDTARSHGRADPHRANPASWELLEPAVRHLDASKGRGKGKGKSKHHRAMPYADVPAFVAELIKNEGPVAGGLLAAVLSGLRANEVYAARWTATEGKDGMWRIPLDGMKAGVGDDDDCHLVPISSGLKALFDRLRPHRGKSGFIFEHRSKAKHIHENSMYNLLTIEMGKRATVHGFRSTISDWGLEVGGFSRDVMDAVLAHAVPGTRGSYQRATFLKQRAKVMEAWSRYCFSAVPAAQRRHLKIAA